MTKKVFSALFTTVYTQQNLDLLFYWAQITTYFILKICIQVDFCIINILEIF
jgi:hypothetical protein